MKNKDPFILYIQYQLLMMTWQHKSPGHQQPWYWPEFSLFWLLAGHLSYVFSGKLIWSNKILILNQYPWSLMLCERLCEDFSNAISKVVIIEHLQTIVWYSGTCIMRLGTCPTKKNSVWGQIQLTHWPLGDVVHCSTCRWVSARKM